MDKNQKNIEFFMHIFMQHAIQRRNTLISDFILRRNAILSDLGNMQARLWEIKLRRARRNEVLRSSFFMMSNFFNVVVPRFRGVRSKPRSNDRWQELQKPEFKDDYFNDFRMPQDTFLELVEKLKVHLEPPTDLPFCNPIPLEMKVAIAIYKMASCAEYRVVGNVFGVHKSTVHNFVHEVVRAINKMQKEFIKFPSTDEALNIACEFERRSHIPNIIGAIDGTHIPVLPPSDGHADYINRKGWPSIIMQAVVDHQYIFRDIFVGFPGSAHDATVFKESGLFQNPGTIIPSRTVNCNGQDVPLMLVGDPAYPLLPWLLKPYTGTVTPEEESFNVHLSSARIVVENAFGRLKGRWRILSKRCDVDPNFLPEIVMSCVILHNFVESKRESFNSSWSPSDTINEQPSRMLMDSIYSNNDHVREVRDRIKVYLAENFPLRNENH